MDAFQASTVTPESNKPNAKGYLDNLHAPYNLNIATTPSTISNANTMVMATMDLYLNGPDGPWNLVGPPRCHDPTTAVNAFDLNYSSAANQSFDMSRPPVRVGPLTDRTAPPTSCPSNIHPPSNAATPSSRSIQNSTRIPHLLGQISNTNPHKKRKTRKKMDFQEKESYNEICKMRACPKCRKGKRKVHLGIVFADR